MSLHNGSIRAPAVVNVDTHHPPSPHPLFLPESDVWFARKIVRPASSTARSGMFSCNQVSVITIMQLSIRLMTSRSFISSILLTRERTLVKKMLGTSGLCGVVVSLARMPAHLPRFRRLPQDRCHLVSVRSCRRILSGNKWSPSRVQQVQCCHSVSPT